MTRDELRQLVDEVRQRRSELDNVEVKTARGGTPTRLHESLSAFANRTGGGVLLFGLSESGDFAVAGVGNVHRLQEEITHLASTNMEPTLRPQFVVDEIDDETVVAVEVAEVPATQKPCFYKQAGLPSGAYLRVGNTNRQMTEYEVSGYLSSRGQPTHDEDPGADATLDDLNSELLDEYVAQLRRARPRASFLEGSREEVLGRENLEEEHSTRNARLMRMMEDMHIVENRGSGVKAMLQAMREANLEPPRFTDRRASFRVTFLNHTLMNPDAIAWLNQFATRALNDHQRLALLYLRQHGEIYNGIYRRLNRVDAMTAGQELHRLVEADLVAQQGVGRWTSYRLNAPIELPEQRVPQSEEEKILAYVRQHGSITNTECRALLDVSLQRSS